MGRLARRRLHPLQAVRHRGCPARAGQAGWAGWPARLAGPAGRPEHRRGRVRGHKIEAPAISPVPRHPLQKPVPRHPPASLHVQYASSPSGARPQSSLIRVSRLVTLLPGSGTGPHSPSAHCRRPGTQSAPLAGLHLQPAAPSESLPCRHARARARVGACTGSFQVHPCLQCTSGLRPGPAHGAGPLIRHFKVSVARPLPDPVWHWPPRAVYCQHPLLWLAGPAGTSRAAEPSVASAISTQCWITGC